MRTHKYQTDFKLADSGGPIARICMGFDGETVSNRYLIYLEIKWPGSRQTLQAKSAAANPDALEIDKDLRRRVDSLTSLYQVTFIMESNAAGDKDVFERWMCLPVVEEALRLLVLQLVDQACEAGDVAPSLTGSSQGGEGSREESGPDNSLGGTSRTNPPSTNTNGSK